MGRRSKMRDVVNVDDDEDEIEGEDPDEYEASKPLSKPAHKSSKRTHDQYMEKFRSELDTMRSELLANLEKKEALMRAKEAKQKLKLQKQLSNGLPTPSTASANAIEANIPSYSFAESKLGKAVNRSLEKSHGLLAKYDHLGGSIKKNTPSVSKLSKDLEVKHGDLKRLLDTGYRVSERQIKASIDRDNFGKENARQGMDEKEQNAMASLGVDGNGMELHNIAKVLESWERGYKRCMSELPDDEED